MSVAVPLVYSLCVSLFHARFIVVSFCLSMSLFHPLPYSNSESLIHAVDPRRPLHSAGMPLWLLQRNLLRAKALQDEEIRSSMEQLHRENAIEQRHIRHPQNETFRPKRELQQPEEHPPAS